MYFLRSLLQN